MWEAKEEGAATTGEKVEDAAATGEAVEERSQYGMERVPPPCGRDVGASRGEARRG
jgi:hypothetical protein